MVSRIPLRPAKVLDVATGTAGVSLELLRRRDAGQVVALDQNQSMLFGGVDAVARSGGRAAESISFVLGRGEELPFAEGTFDALTFTYLLRYVDDPAATLRELSRVVRPGGKMACLEFFVPRNRFVHALWWFHTRIVLPAAGRIDSPAWYRVGRFLGPSISGFYERYPLPDQVGMWRAAGLREIGFRVMSLGGGIVIWAVKGDVG